MKLVRFAKGRLIGWGVVEGDFVRVLRQGPFGRIAYEGSRVRVSRLRVLVPAEPRAIVLVGLNYRDHARELNMPVPAEPIIFLKPVSALCCHRQPIIYPEGVRQMEYEAELALVIKKTCHNITERKAGKYILGYTCLNDVTARDLQKKDGQWTRSKSFDTFCPIGPWLETELDPDNTRVRSYVNGTLKQNSSTADLIFSAHQLVAFISRVMTLQPGDIISTGTPSKVGPLQIGDCVEIEVEGIGRLTNSVHARRSHKP